MSDYAFLKAMGEREMTRPVDPLRPVDDTARGLARALLTQSATAALAVLLPDGAPFVSRIAWAPAPDGGGLTLVSDLATHTGAMRHGPRVSILLGDPTDRGDPLNHPRLSIIAYAQFVPAHTPERLYLREYWLAAHPKAKLYVDFADFSFLRFAFIRASLNAGFAKAYALSSEDLTLP